MPVCLIQPGKKDTNGSRAFNIRAVMRRANAKDTLGCWASLGLARLGALGRVGRRRIPTGRRFTRRQTDGPRKRLTKNEHKRRPTSSGASGMDALSPVFCLSIIYLAAMPSAIQIIQSSNLYSHREMRRRPLVTTFLLVTAARRPRHKSNNDKNRCPLYENQNGKKNKYNRVKRGVFVRPFIFDFYYLFDHLATHDTNSPHRGAVP